MLNSRFLLLPFGLQMVCVALDEIHFHRHRELPRWERIGHPLDTLTVLICLLWLVLVPPGAGALLIYVGLSVFSCLFVTKDEGVHLRHCRPSEQRLHAFLFALHPLTFLSAGMLWPAAHGIGDSWRGLIRCMGNERSLLLALCTMVFAFAVYQFIYWNLPWRRSKAAR